MRAKVLILALIAAVFALPVPASQMLAGTFSAPSPAGQSRVFSTTLTIVKELAPRSKKLSSSPTSASPRTSTPWSAR